MQTSMASTQQRTVQPWIQSLLTGAFICLAFPKWNVSWIAWFALVPLLFSTQGMGLKRAFFQGWLAGFTAFCGILYWLTPTFRAAQAPAALGIFSTALLAGYIALYWGFFTAAMETAFKRRPQADCLLLGTALWVALEWVRNHALSGFPWGALGYSQWQHPHILQIAAWTGVYGVSAILVFCNLALYLLLERRKLEFSRGLLMTLAVGAGLFLYAALRPFSEDRGRPIHVAVLQGNIDQYKKWGPGYVSEIQDVYRNLALSRTATDLTVWPESSVPGWVPQDVEITSWLRETVRASSGAHLIGAVTQENNRSYNSAFLFAPDGTAVGRYDKIHLVPFGEFVPFENILGRAIPVLNQLGGFSPGRSHEPLDVSGAKIGVTVCYEAVFPESVRRLENAGAEVLANITNDGWYLDTAAPEQHFAMNVLRAVENRRYLVRAANTGISGVIGPDGTVLARTRLGERTRLEAVVYPIKAKTFYARHGDWFAGLCAGLSFIALAAQFFKRKRSPI